LEDEMVKWIVVNHLWVPILFAYYFFYNWIGWNNNQEGSSKGWFYGMLFCGFVQIWAVVSRYSENILLDGMIYDIIIFLTFPVTMWYMGETNNFSVQQWVGLVVVVIGFLLLKVDISVFAKGTK
jgi:hypothetical protein